MKYLSKCVGYMQDKHTMPTPFPGCPPQTSHLASSSNPLVPCFFSIHCLVAATFLPVPIVWWQPPFYQYPLFPNPSQLSFHPTLWWWEPLTGARFLTQGCMMVLPLYGLTYTFHHTTYSNDCNNVVCLVGDSTWIDRYMSYWLPIQCVGTSWRYVQWKTQTLSRGG